MLKKILKTTFFLALFSAITSNLFCYEESNENYYFSQTTNRRNGNISNSEYPILNTWWPQACKSRIIWDSQKFFFTNTVGIGFLYFSGTKGGPLYNSTAQNLRAPNNNSFGKYTFSYNKTCLYEGSLNWKVFNFLTAGLMYTSQSNVNFKTRMHTLAPTAGLPTNWYTFSSSVNLNALGLKVGFYFPVSHVLYSVGATPYLNLSVGPCWQTWSNIVLYNEAQKTAFNFRQKVSANCFFSTDLGFKFQSLQRNTMNSFCIVAGCKFNIWGQARAMGKEGQQLGRGAPGNANIGNQQQSFFLLFPPQIKTVYQFAPYIGVTLAF